MSMTFDDTRACILASRKIEQQQQFQNPTEPYPATTSTKKKKRNKQRRGSLVGKLGRKVASLATLSGGSKSKNDVRNTSPSPHSRNRSRSRDIDDMLSPSKPASSSTSKTLNASWGNMLLHNGKRSSTARSKSSADSIDDMLSPSKPASTSKMLNASWGNYGKQRSSPTSSKTSRTSPTTSPTTSKNGSSKMNASWGSNMLLHSTKAPPFSSPSHKKKKPIKRSKSLEDLDFDDMVGTDEFKIMHGMSRDRALYLICKELDLE